LNSARRGLKTHERIDRERKKRKGRWGPVWMFAKRPATETGLPVRFWEDLLDPPFRPIRSVETKYAVQKAF